MSPAHGLLLQNSLDHNHFAIAAEIIEAMTLSEFFFNLPIYSPFEITSENQDTLKKILDYNNRGEFEGYNPWKKVESTFVVITDLLPTGSGNAFLERGGHNTVKIKCKRTDDIFWFYIRWKPKDKTLMKTGQFPTVADFHISEIKQYSGLISTERLKEFTRAIGLAANGVGIGSFVYLRRIFEYLISEAFTRAKSDNVITDGDFQRIRMDEKIDKLRGYLPTFLVDNKGLYSILSLGIHELDESTCLAHFDTLRVGIEIILDEKLDESKKKEKIQQAKQKLDLLKGQIKK